MSKVDASKLFVGLRNPPSYHESIQITDVTQRKLVVASRKIREELRSKLGNYENIPGVDVSQLYETTNIRNRVRIAAREIGLSAPVLSPKFLRQGSMAYSLALEPCFPDKQMVDLDDGVYFPMQFFAGNNPALTPYGLFIVVEEALRPLCERQGWTLIDRNHPDAKRSCVRLIIASNAHIDLPLYAIPENDFQQLQESMIEFADAGQPTINDIRATQLDTRRIQLAHRENGWENSDPRVLHEWFDDVCELYPGARRVCRYLKGWRDFRWESGGPSSIALMACAAAALYEINDDFENRDDLLLQAVCGKLIRLLQGPIKNPAFRSETYAPLDSSWSDSERKEYIQAATNLYDSISYALDQINKQSIIDRLREAFGERFPDFFAAISFVGTVAPTVLASEPDPQPLPMVGRHISG